MKKVVYDVYFCGQYDHSFTENNMEEVKRMENNLNNPWNDIWDYTKNGLPLERVADVPESKYNYL